MSATVNPMTPEDKKRLFRKVTLTLWELEEILTMTREVKLLYYRHGKEEALKDMVALEDKIKLAIRSERTLQ